MPQLIVNVKSNYPQIHDLVIEKISIGRTGDNTIKLYDSCVSVSHAEIRRDEDGSYRLYDLDSFNGTEVNGAPVEGMILKDGDEIKFGTVKALFLDPQESPASRSPNGTKVKSEKEKSNEKRLVALERDIQSKSEELVKLDDVFRTKTSHLDSDIQTKSEELAKLEEVFKKKTSHLDSIKVSKLGELEKVSVELKRQNEKERDNLNSFRSQLETAQQKQTDLMARLKELEGEVSKFEKKRNELEEECKRVSTTTESSLRKNKELEEELKRLQTEIGQAKADLEEKRRASQEAARVVAEAKAMQTRMGEIEGEVKSREKACDELGKAITDREKSRETLDKEIGARRGELEKLTGVLEGKRKEVEGLAREAAAKEERIQSISGKVSTMEVTFQKSLDDLSKTLKTQKSLKEESETLSRLIGEKTGMLQNLKAKVSARVSGASGGEGSPPFRVINPLMRSLVHYFHHGPGIPDQDRVDPIGYYGLAACTRGSMHRETDTIPAGEEPILVLLQGEMDKDRELIKSISLELANRVLLVCWREGQLDAIASQQKVSPESLKLDDLLAGVSGIVSVDSRSARILEDLQLGRPHLNIPFPCPVEFSEWNIPVSTTRRPRGVFISGGGFDPASRLHRARLELLSKLVVDTKTTVTLDHRVPDLVAGLKFPHELLTVGAIPLKYSEYLTMMRKHYLVTGFGKNLSGGEVIGDVILARAVFVGADSGNPIDELLFPDSCIIGDNINGALKNATRLLSDHAAYAETVEQAQGLAPQLISFESVSDRLKEFVRFISANSAAV